MSVKNNGGVDNQARSQTTWCIATYCQYKQA